MTNRRFWLIPVVLWAAIGVGAAADEQAPPQPSIQAVPEPGYLEVVEMTAVNLDGRLAGGPEPTGYKWRIVDGGDDGRLFDTEKEDAVFLAPKVDEGSRDWIIELTVTFADEKPAVRRLRIRVLSEKAAQAAQGANKGTDDGKDGASGGGGDDTQWIQDYYKQAQEQEDKRKSQSPTIIVPNNTGTSVHFGYSPWGWGWGGSVGFRWTMSYPISQPVDVPPPGETQQPGEGKWDVPTPVPYGQIGERFPSDVADRFSPADDPTAGKQGE
jgi:hypothetical protein